MSAAEIIRELPKLTEADRRAIREGLLEIANANPDIALISVRHGSCPPGELLDFRGRYDQWQ
jgi:hypothetical protein